MVNEALVLDDIDKSIVQFIQEDPTITHTQIAKKINRSQPTVGMRIKKLEKLGVLTFQAGLNLKNTNYYLSKVSFQSSDPSAIIKIIKSCPYMIQGYITSGISNFEIIIANPHLKNIDKIVNYHFRNNPKVGKINIEIITNIINEFVIPVDFRIQSCNCVKNSNRNEIYVSQNRRN